MNIENIHRKVHEVLSRIHHGIDALADGAEKTALASDAKQIALDYLNHEYPTAAYHNAEIVLARIEHKAARRMAMKWIEKADRIFAGRKEKKEKKE